MTPLLDITRLMSRAGRVLTGVDRVELAYLDEMLRRGGAFGLARTGLGFLLLDHAGLARFRARIETGDFGPVDRLSRWARRLTPAQKAANSSLRADAVARCRLRGLAKMVKSRRISDYLNTGHANLEPAVLKAIGAGRARRHVLIHDTIPLDHPHWQRPGTPEVFRGKLAAALAGADRIICNSQVTAEGIARHAAGAMPPLVIAPLGVTVPQPGEPPLNRPYFTTIGTIEPRKNHALLLDVWEETPDLPPLYICGPRGWNNDAVFARLDAGVPGVTELPDLDDAALATHLAGAQALLFPSLAEGYGLPPVEAAVLGVPVVCGDLAIYRETLGDIPVYVKQTDPYHWAKVVKELAEQTPPEKPFAPPTWAAHFKTVLSVS